MIGRSVSRCPQRQSKTAQVQKERSHQGPHSHSGSSERPEATDAGPGPQSSESEADPARVPRLPEKRGTCRWVGVYPCAQSPVGPSNNSKRLNS